MHTAQVRLLPNASTFQKFPPHQMLLIFSLFVKSLSPRPYLWPIPSTAFAVFVHWSVLGGWTLDGRVLTLWAYSVTLHILTLGVPEAQEGNESILFYGTAYCPMLLLILSHSPGFQERMSASLLLWKLCIRVYVAGGKGQGRRWRGLEGRYPTHLQGGENQEKFMDKPS